jgi:hypothetical protein
MDEITSQLSLLKNATESSTVSNGRGDDVFGISGKEDFRRSDPFDPRHAVSTTEIEKRQSSMISTFRMKAMSWPPLTLFLGQVMMARTAAAQHLFYVQPANLPS